MINDLRLSDIYLPNLISFIYLCRQVFSPTFQSAMLNVITCPIVSNGLVKVAHYIPKYILKSVENYLVMINSMMDKKFISQIGTKCAILDEKLYFQRFTLVKMNSWSISISIYI